MNIVPAATHTQIRQRPKEPASTWPARNLVNLRFLWRLGESRPQRGICTCTRKTTKLPKHLAHVPRRLAIANSFAPDEPLANHFLPRLLFVEFSVTERRETHRLRRDCVDALVWPCQGLQPAFAHRNRARAGLTKMASVSLPARTPRSSTLSRSGRFSVFGELLDEHPA